MALGKNALWAYGKLGFIAAIATGFLLKLISQLVSMIPGVSLDLQSVSVSTSGISTFVNTGMSTYAKKLFGIIPFVSLPEWIYVGVGGALFVIVGAYIADYLKLLKGDKQKQLTTVMVTAAIVTGWILSMSIGIPAISAIIALVVDAYILSWLLIAIDKSMKTKLVP